MRILNFAHPLTEKQIQQLSELIGHEILTERIQAVPVHFDTEQGFAKQVLEMLDKLEISSDTWQKESWLIVLPSLNFITAVLLAELHGRIGHFPSVVRLKPIRDTLVPEFELAEILYLNQIRLDARLHRDG